MPRPEAFLDKIAAIPNIVIVPLTAESAPAGRRDQIRQRSPGRMS
jgi:hypothetical protein